VPSAGIVYGSPCNGIISNNTVFNARQVGIYLDQTSSSFCSTTGANTVNNNIVINNGAAHQEGYGIKQANDTAPHVANVFYNNLLYGNYPTNTIGFVTSTDVVSRTITGEPPTVTFVN